MNEEIFPEARGVKEKAESARGFALRRGWASEASLRAKRASSRPNIVAVQWAEDILVTGSTGRRGKIGADQ